MCQLRVLHVIIKQFFLDFRNNRFKQLACANVMCFMWNLYIFSAVRCLDICLYVRNGGRGQLSSKGRHIESDIIMRMGAAVTIAGLWLYGIWQCVATGCTALVFIEYG